MDEASERPAQGAGSASPLPDEDRPLVERAQAGDTRAFELLVLKYQRRVERLVARMIRDPALVEEVTQEAFIRAWRALRQFRGDAQFYTWLYRIAVNTAKKALLELKRMPQTRSDSAEAEDDETSGAKDEPTTAETPESELAAREIAEAVHAAVEDLPPELREAVTLREIDGLSYEEIANVMNSPIGTVRSRIFRAREAIASRLRPLLEHRSGKRW